jgi:hypothetical protein
VGSEWSGSAVSDVRDPATDQAAPIGNDLPSMHDHAVDLMRERKAHGLRKYGQLLQPNNGRSFEQDAVEEVADLMVYLLGLKWERENPEETWLGPLCWALISGDGHWGDLGSIQGIPPQVLTMVDRMTKSLDAET